MVVTLDQHQRCLPTTHCLTSVPYKMSVGYPWRPNNFLPPNQQDQRQLPQRQLQSTVKTESVITSTMNNVNSNISNIISNDKTTKPTTSLTPRNFTKSSTSGFHPLKCFPSSQPNIEFSCSLLLSELITVLFFLDPTVLDSVGTNHDLHVDPVQRKRVVKALQKANAAEVNEVITILKAMPDPTLVEFKKDHVRDPSTVKGPPLPATTDGGDSEGKGPRKKPTESIDQTTGVPDTESIPAPSSWWAVSLGSLLSSFSSTDTAGPATSTLPTSTATITTNAEVSAFTTSAAVKPPKPTPTTRETLAQGTTALLIALADAKAKETKAAAAASKEKEALAAGPKSKSKIVISSKSATLDKATVVSTINSISKQALALYLPPPTHMISAYTYWWGYEIYVPHKCMSKLEKVTNTSQIFFGFLSGTIASLPGLAALSPLARIISAWVGFQWAVIKAEDLGKGVVLSATWVLPVALAPRPWDHPGTEDVPPVEDKKQKRIKA